MAEVPPLATVFLNDLIATVDKYRGEGITVAEALGSIEILKYDLLNELCRKVNDGQEEDG